MTSTIRAWAYAALVLSIVIYRSGNTLRNVIVTKRDLPTGYYHAGNFSEHCTSFQAPGLSFCEDARFWNIYDTHDALTARHLILSCDPGRMAWNTVMGPLRDPQPHGALWLYTSYSSQGGAHPAPHRILLENYPKDHDFHPLGLDIWPSRQRNESNLYVTNHARQRTMIEHFVLSPEEPTVARHIRTISSPYFLSPNAIALTSPNSFYVSNDHLITRRLPIVGHVLPVIESILGLPLGFVLHVTLSADTQPTIENLSLSAPFFPFANGVAVSPDGSSLAVASSSLAQIQIFDRDPVTNTLTRRSHTIDLPFAVDNLDFSDDGTLYAAGHPHFPTLVQVAANKTQYAPSWAVAIPPLPREKVVPPVEFDVNAPTSLKGLVTGVSGLATVFQSDGQGFATSSTALKDDKTGVLYVTGLYADKGFIACQPAA
ncbi:hypothetical protein AX15_001952 [Amanita polypyramis BW_CC]|nr:hypothetical protein AX15_001952 [Amanita polypyramis BW_CC]